VSPAKDNAELLEIDGREVRISNPDKVVFPEPG
jgi:bifunctional non-homologous end joining protein LigD